MTSPAPLPQIQTAPSPDASAVARLTSYRVSFCEWTVWRLRVDAMSAAEALQKAHALFEAEGPEAFEIADNGIESWRAEGGGDVLEVDDVSGGEVVS